MRRKETTTAEEKPCQAIDHAMNHAIEKAQAKEKTDDDDGLSAIRRRMTKLVDLMIVWSIRQTHQMTREKTTSTIARLALVSPTASH